MGYLKDENGQPLKGKFVRLYLPNTWTVRTRTLDDGLFRLLLGATAERKGKGLVIKLGDRTMRKDSKAAEYALFMLPPNYKQCAQVGPAAPVAVRVASSRRVTAVAPPTAGTDAAERRIAPCRRPGVATRLHAMPLPRWRLRAAVPPERLTRAAAPLLIVRVLEGLTAWVFFNESFSIAPVRGFWLVQGAFIAYLLLNLLIALRYRLGRVSACACCSATSRSTS